MTTITTSILSLVELTNRYFHQLLDGCNNQDCRESLCATGQRNASPPGRPVRKWSPRSARAIAIALAEHSAPAAHLCPYCPSCPSASSNAATYEETAGDNRSLTQQLCDTEAVKTLTSKDLKAHAKLAQVWQSGSLTTLEERIKLHQDLDNMHFGASDIGIAAATLAQAFMAVVAGPDDGDVAPLVDAACLTGRGRALPDHQRRASDHMKTLLSFMDELSNETSNRLVNKVFSTLFRWTCAEEQAGLLEHEYFPQRPGDYRLVEHFADSLIVWCRSPPTSAKIAAWTQRVFLKHWHAQPLIGEPAAIAALQFLQAFWNDTLHETKMDSLIDRSWLLRTVPYMLDDLEVAGTWLCPTMSGRHVLSFPILFTTMERIKYFRTINVLRMQDAYSAVEVNIRFRATMQQLPSDGAVVPAAVEHGERHYLLLNVSRDAVLRDAYDQLWQRRRGELLRPLRIRLGEMEQLEIGQDLGGVQIEFFNLLCKTMFAEDLGMFTVLDQRTGMHFFRFGSLQPLYMFELVGLLFALAVYNGITLPVSLPRAFYQRLLRPCMQMPNETDKTLDLLQDGWPMERRSMQALLKTAKPEELMQDYVFPFDANGLRGAAFLPHVAEHANILQIADSLPSVEKNALVAEWPGWLVVGAEDHGAEVNIITRYNRAQYLRDYVSWVTYLSVKPQWDAFAAGFGRIFDSNFGRQNQGPLSAGTDFNASADLNVHLGTACSSKRKDLAMFDTETLQACVEGISTLDILELRAGTSYEGYDPDSPYIGYFWEVVSSWPQEKQKQLLKFVTAAERLPVGGARSITFVIQRTATECSDERANLPTSSTCFGTLMLPFYANKNIMERNLSLAVEMGCEGFGTG